MKSFGVGVILYEKAVVLMTFDGSNVDFIVSDVGFDYMV